MQDADRGRAAADRTLHVCTPPMLALAVFASTSVALADGRVVLVVSNSTDAHIGRLPNPENDAGRPGGRRAAAARVRGDDGARRRSGGAEQGVAGVHAPGSGADVSLVFYAGYGRLERDVDVRYETVTLDDLLVSTAAA